MIDHRLGGAEHPKQSREQRAVEIRLGDGVRPARSYRLDEGASIVLALFEDAEEAESGLVRVRGRLEQVDEPRIRGQRRSDDPVDVAEEAGGRRGAGRGP
ncbi:Uncharacterised protein [Mycobacteroides abscessus subsp. abscessus]|nr:Uncharacterised protein [Mycobacteroides abscessus subsp. abscessus]